MNRGALDWRLWLPLAIGTVAWAGREVTAAPVAAAEPPVTALALPLPRLLTLPVRDQVYDLDAERSYVRFLVEGEGEELLVQCPVVSGSLELRADPAASVLELRLDLGSVVPTEEGPRSEAAIDLRHLLGVHRGNELIFRGTLLSTSTAPVPGLLHHLWLGTMRFGNRVVRQPIALWQTALPGQPVRLQGHGTVAVEPYGLPRRVWLGLVQERHVVTLGLDLAWKRRASR